MTRYTADDIEELRTFIDHCHGMIPALDVITKQAFHLLCDDRGIEFNRVSLEPGFPPPRCHNGDYDMDGYDVEEDDG